MTVLLIGVSVASFSVAWVLRDGRTRELPTRKAVTWAVLCTQEWPLLPVLYRRIRPRRARGEGPSAPA